VVVQERASGEMKDSEEGKTSEARSCDNAKGRGKGKVANPVDAMQNVVKTCALKRYMAASVLVLGSELTLLYVEEDNAHPQPDDYSGLVIWDWCADCEVRRIPLGTDLAPNWCRLIHNLRALQGSSQAHFMVDGNRVLLGAPSRA